MGTMEQKETERIARRFHEVYEQLAPQIGRKTQEASAVAWSDLPDENRKLMIMTVGVVMAELDTEKLDAQRLEFDRNHWQRKVGVLLALIEAPYGDVYVRQEAREKMIESARKAVNTNWYTKSLDEPVADVARMTVEQTLQTAVDAGLVQRVTNGAGG